jgi:hypothetical protein
MVSWLNAGQPDAGVRKRPVSRSSSHYDHTHEAMRGHPCPARNQSDQRRAQCEARPLRRDRRTARRILGLESGPAHTDCVWLCGSCNALAVVSGDGPAAAEGLHGGSSGLWSSKNIGAMAVAHPPPRMPAAVRVVLQR